MSIRRGEYAQDCPWGSQPEGMEDASRLVDLFGRQVGSLRDEHSVVYPIQPESLGAILARTLKKLKQNGDRQKV